MIHLIHHFKCFSAYLPTYLPFYLSIYLSIYLSVFLHIDYSSKTSASMHHLQTTNGCPVLSYPVRIDFVIVLLPLYASARLAWVMDFLKQRLSSSFRPCPRLLSIQCLRKISFRSSGKISVHPVIRFLIKLMGSRTTASLTVDRESWSILDTCRALF
jgi:hypothetical protein